MAPNKLQLMGQFQLIHRNRQVALDSSRLQTLVALLAMQPGQPIKRTRIAYHFWPESSEKQARTNTRNLLFKLKQAWPALDDLIHIDRNQITWQAGAAMDVDVQQFDQLCSEAAEREHADDRIPLLVAAADANTGDLLPDCYTEWILCAREQLRARYASVLEQLIGALLEKRRYGAALERAEQLCVHDPLRESTYRHLMQIHALLGQRARALRAYHSCASILRKELGITPGPATTQLHARLLQNNHYPASYDDAPRPVSQQRLVGRHAEWGLLQKAWNDVQSERAHCLIIWGETGIGKTRLAEEFVDWAGRQGHACASSRAYVTDGQLAYAPISEWLRSPRLQPTLEAVDDLWRVELARLQPALLSMRPELPLPGPLTEVWQQQRFFQGIVQAFKAVSGPLLLHLDDMQWCEPETLALLQFLFHGARAHPLLLVGAIRPEDLRENPSLAALVAALRHNDQLTEIHLGPLSDEESKKLIEQTANAPIAPAIIDELCMKGEGHPLYLVEMVRGKLNDATSRASLPEERASILQGDIKGEMPARLYNLISMRLDQLSFAAQEVASTAAIIGRDFTYEALHAATRMDELKLVDALDELWRQRLIREQGSDAYDFTHDRVREVAYRRVSRARRQLLDDRTTAILQRSNIGVPDASYSQLTSSHVVAGAPTSFSVFDRQTSTRVVVHALLGGAPMIMEPIR